LLISTLAVSGCEWPAIFPGPISEPGATEIDKRFVGSWYALLGEEGPSPEGLIFYLNIGLSEDSLLNAVFFIKPAQPVFLESDKRSSEIEEDWMWLTATAWPSIIDGAVYYNVRLRDYGPDDFISKCPATSSDCYFVARVSFPDKDRLVLHTIGGPTVRTLIKKGKVPGEELGKIVMEYYLDISGTEIVSLLRDYPGDELFQNPGNPEIPVVFHRLKPTVTEP